MESFNGRLRDECINEHLFTSYRHAREIIEDWRNDYNLNRPHTSLNGLTPEIPAPAGPNSGSTSDGVGLFLSQPRRGVIQGILNAKGVALRLSHMFRDAKLVYEREFRVSLRRVPSPRMGRVWLIGDAAHVQSPVGGQGLNLAVWDGVTLGRALAQNQTEVEEALRNRARSVLRFTHFDYLMLSTKWRSVQYLRNSYWKFAARFPRSAVWFFRLISGTW